MRAELSRWYKARQRTHQDNLTRAHDLTLKMLGGTPMTPKLALSGAETWGFMLFLINCLERYQPLLPESSRSWLEAGRRL
eukprot:8709517-Alexandrium_andersonii.AAC.1